MKNDYGYKENKNQQPDRSQSKINDRPYKTLHLPTYSPSDYSYKDRVQVAMRTFSSTPCQTTYITFPIKTAI